MQDPTDATLQASRREPWNKGKLIGAKSRRKKLAPALSSPPKQQESMW